MIFPKKTAAIAVAAVALLVGASLAWRTWISEHDSRVRAEASIEATKKLLDEASERQEARDAQLAESLEEIARVKRETRTPREIVREIPKYLPLPQPITLAEPERSPITGELTAPTAVIPQEDLKPLWDFVQDCRACQAELVTAHEDLVDERKKTQVLSEQRDDALKLAKGGGLWRRLKRGAKWFAIGAAAGAIAATAAR